ncbi:MAG: MFS transporter [Chloroflexi bacterium]|nr:MFS transporter [Chloroflexota bacterium]
MHTVTRWPWATVLFIDLAVLFAALDQTVVVTVLPEVMLDLDVPPTELDRASWIVTGYLLGYTVAIPFAARLSDVHGHGRIFKASLGLFALGSFLVAVAPSLPWLVAARVAQAVGGGATIPIGMALATQSLSPGKRVLAIGTVGGAAEAGVVLGPLYGGLITAALGWRWLFWLNLPLAAILLAAIAGISSGRNAGARMDYRGGLLLAAALGLLVVAVSRRELFAGSSPLPYGVGAAGLAVAGGLLWTEMRVPQPLLAGVFFRSLPVVSALGLKLLAGAALIMAMVTVPLMANTVLERSPLEGGLLLMRLTGSLAAGALAGGFLAYRLGQRATGAAGMGIAAVGLFLMSGWDTQTSELGFTGPLVVAGLGFGLVIAPAVMTAMEAVGSDYQATAASLVTVARMIGMALGIAALSAWGMEHFQGLTFGLEFPLQGVGETAEDYATRVDAYLGGLTDAGVALFQDFFRVAAVIAALAVLPALGLGSRARG